ncbi:MAG: Crp/Fnr family transcriptional regulator [Chitinophagales bacterium]
MNRSTAAIGESLEVQQVSIEAMLPLLTNDGGYTPPPRKVRKGDFVYLPNDINNKVYVVKSGRVKVGTYSGKGKEMVKGILRNGEIFGELRLIHKHQNNEFAQAIDNVEVYVIPLVRMRELMRRDLDFSFKIMEIIADRLNETQRRLELQLFKDTKSRVIQFMLDLAENRGVRVGYETAVREFFTHQEIANITGTSRQTVTSILNELRAENLIYCNHKRLLIRDKERLEELMG